MKNPRIDPYRNVYHAVPEPSAAVKAAARRGDPNARRLVTAALEMNGDWYALRALEASGSTDAAVPASEAVKRRRP